MKNKAKFANPAKEKELIDNKNVYLYFLPSPYLKSLIAKGEDPIVRNMPDCRKADLLSEHGIMIQKKMVSKWLDGTLDDRNSFILSNGDIRVVDANWRLQDKVIGVKNDQRNRK
jgi:hypothetical protein